MMTCLNLIRNYWFQILVITFIGAILRFWGILHGFQEGFIYHPDAVFIIGDIWSRYLGADWLIGTYAGPIYNFLSVCAIGILEFITGYLGYRPEWSFEFLVSISSLLSAVLGTATIPFVYLMTSKAYDKPSGIWAALILAICPLHSFHSHYPYRDAPMVFFLVITLYICIHILFKNSFSLVAFIGLGSLATLITATIKPAGLMVAIPLLVASLIALFKSKRWWLVIPIGIVFISALVLFKQDSINHRFTNNMASIMNYFWDGYPICYENFKVVFKTLAQWIGLSYIIPMVLAVGYSVWCRQKSDIVVLSFLLCGFISVTFIRYFDERFLVFLLPALAMILGRYVVIVWRRSSRFKIVKIALSIAIGIILLNTLHQTVWQGIMFSLLDTRFLSAKWANAHLSKENKIAVEGYYPLGINEWPNVAFFDLSHPPRREIEKANVIITSSLEHQHFFDKAERYSNQILFYNTLRQEALPIKKFVLSPLGFIQPSIEVFQPISSQQFSKKGRGESIPAFPKPYDANWNGGVSFLERGPIDRDDRSFFLGWQHRYTATLVSPKTGQEMVVFMINGPEKSLVRVRVGFKAKTRTLKPGEFHILTFHPHWFFPKRPALYHFEAGMPEGKKVFIQLRCGNREIGTAYAKWGLYDKALPYLKQALADDPFDSESQFLLAKVEKQLGQTNEAKQTIRGLTEKNYQYIQMVLSLGQPGLPADKWGQLFREYTKLAPSLLTYALSQEFNTEKAFPSRSGEIKKDCQASGGQEIVFDSGIHKPDEVMHGPYVYLDQGAYRAGFFFRTWNVTGSGPLAVIKVLADDHVISVQSVSAKDLKNSDKPFKKIEIPFVNANPRAEIKFQVFATGSASFAVDKVRIEPDLRKTFEEKLSQLKSISK